MDRSTLGPLPLALAVAALITAAAMQSGCVSALATVAWMVKGNDEAAEFEGLKHKRVAVICRPLVELQYSAGSRAAGDLAVEVGQLLSQRVRKISVVDSREVAEWADEHEWDDYGEVGKALKADMVVGIEIEEFSLFQSQTLYQGKARMNLTVYNVAEGKVAKQWSVPQVVFPPNRGVDTSMPEEDFRRRFVAHLADILGRYFYSHDGHNDLALDAKGINQER